MGGGRPPAGAGGLQPPIDMSMKIEKNEKN